MSNKMWCESRNYYKKRISIFYDISGKKVPFQSLQSHKKNNSLNSYKNSISKQDLEALEYLIGLNFIHFCIWMISEESLLQSLIKNELTGNDLASMVQRGEITKQLRRKVTKKFAAASKKKELSARQKLRLEVKEKKSQPKKTREEQIQKYRVDLDQERELKQAQSSTCLGCRKPGHILKYCPEAVKEVGICFNCGSTDHTLKNCSARRDPKGTLKFAKCFVCNGTGHIAKDCAENANGLYPKGGCCHICLQKTHLAKDCPERTEEDRERYKKAKQEQEDAELGPRIGIVASANSRGDDIDDYFEAADANPEYASDMDEEKAERKKKDKKDKKASKKRKRDD